MKAILPLIEDLSKIYNFEIADFKQNNKMALLKIKTAKTNGPNRDLENVIYSLPCFTKIKNSSDFFMCKKDVPYSYYELQISIHNDYFDTTAVDDSKVSGKIIKYVLDNNIQSIEDFGNMIIPMITNLSMYIHTLPSGVEKKELRAIKKNCIKFLYMNNLITSIERQISYCNDILLLFRTATPHLYHLRYFGVHFIDNVDEIKDIEEVYQKRDISNDVIDYTFKEHLSLLKNMNQHYLIKNAINF